MMINAGRLNHRITIEQRGAGQDAWGQPVETWEPVAELWASVLYLSGLSAIKAGADVSISKVSIRIRHRAGLNAGMRVLHDGKVFDIQAVLPDGARQFVDLVCEVVA